jgi:hypothetical protein
MNAPCQSPDGKINTLHRGRTRPRLGADRDVAGLAEQHFGLDVLAWPTVKAVSGLCAHGQGIAMMLISTAFSRGHQRFTAAHELAHHLLRDPREIVVDAGPYGTGSPIEQRANAFAAALLIPADREAELHTHRSLWQRCGIPRLIPDLLLERRGLARRGQLNHVTLTERRLPEAGHRPSIRTKKSTLMCSLHLGKEIIDRVHEYRQIHCAMTRILGYDVEARHF